MPADERVLEASSMWINQRAVAVVERSSTRLARHRRLSVSRDTSADRGRRAGLKPMTQGSGAQPPFYPTQSRDSSPWAHEWIERTEGVGAVTGGYATGLQGSPSAHRFPDSPPPPEGGGAWRRPSSDSGSSQPDQVSSSLGRQPTGIVFSNSSHPVGTDTGSMRSGEWLNGTPFRAGNRVDPSPGFG